MSDIDDILSPDPGNSRSPLPEDKLMAYLDGKLSTKEQREVEQWFASEGMESDAIEGLAAIQPGETRRSVAKLNRKLGKTIAGRRRRRTPLNTNQYAIIAIAIILMLGIVVFCIIKMQK